MTALRSPVGRELCLALFWSQQNPEFPCGELIHTPIHSTHLIPQNFEEQTWRNPKLKEKGGDSPGLGVNPIVLYSDLWAPTPRRSSPQTCIEHSLWISGTGATGRNQSRKECDGQTQKIQSRLLYRWRRNCVVTLRTQDTLALSLEALPLEHKHGLE